VTYTQDLKRMFRLSLRLRRWRLYIIWTVGAFCLLEAVLAGSTARPGRVPVTAYFATLAVLCFVLPMAFLWVRMYLQRRSFAGEVDLTVTDQLITRRTAIETLEFGWDSVRRVLQRRGMWIFVVNFFTQVAVYKSDLSAEQCAELEAFLARRSSALSGPWTSALGP
jgi:hypothetical protein